MSDILIRGMDMPKGDNTISIVIFSNGKVSLAHDKKYAEYAEAIPLPPHGRCIDADALIRDKSSEATLWCGYEYQDHPIVFEEDIKNALTIVPAEGVSDADKKTNCSDCGNQNTPVCKYCEHDAEDGDKNGI